MIGEQSNNDIILQGFVPCFREKKGALRNTGGPPVILFQNVIFISMQEWS